MAHLRRVWDANPQVDGVDQSWRPLQREGIPVARCTVARRRRRLGLRGVRRGQVVRATVATPAVPGPLDRVNRPLQAERPHPLWVADCTDVSTWPGFVSVAFIIEVFARSMVGWRVSRSLQTDFVLEALAQAL